MFQEMLVIEVVKTAGDTVSADDSDSDVVEEEPDERVYKPVTADTVQEMLKGYLFLRHMKTS